MTLENTGIYAIALSGILLSFFIAAYLLPWFLSITESLSIFAARNFTYTFLLSRYRWIGPWTAAAVVLQSAYIIANFFCVLFRVSSLLEAAIRAGRLSLINAMPLFLSPHLSFLADLFGMPIRTFRKIHGSSGAMSSGLLLFHVVVMMLLGKTQDLYVSLGALSLVIIPFLSISILRRAFYEVFLRSHQALAIYVAYSIWRHLWFVPGFPWFYVYLYGGAACLVNLVQLGIMTYRNKKWGSPLPRLLLGQDGGGICMTVELSRPVRIEAGQYINLWIWAPRISLWSWMQSHPFTVASWSPTEQTSLEIIVEPHSGLSSKLVQTSALTKTGDDGSSSYVAVFTGPHGISFPLWGFKTVVMFATGFGIAVMLPYLEKLIHGHKTFRGRANRIHLVWNVQNLTGFKRVVHLLNHHLEDDAIGKGYILRISIYIESGVKEEEFGDHGRAAFFMGAPDLRKILKAEENGDFIQQTEKDTIGNGVVSLVSGTDQLRDRLRGLVRSYLHKRMELKELDYQPR
ncbi:hypothetical protein QBC46DRAFT_275313 [Diplogelasinospora grovesii]|uniref:FAD-binding FR-type domain-containing protein n=1 Tax=Diplogelasinospora grovesii TaxID=303347 RepID=A0AAN6MVA8_9PEZI|nr:hypothetical protein QBC46DRAFT_275313 [Diplogelasinospora grovesii]